MDTARVLVRELRACGPLLLARAEDPHAELMAMVWSSRFDRAHAQSLLRLQGEPVAGLLQRLDTAAERYDGMPSRHQQRLRRLIARHGACGTSWSPSHNRSQS